MRTAILIFFTAILSSIAVAQPRINYMLPTWSPDGKWLTYTKMEFTPGTPPSMNGEIYIMRADGTGITRVLENSDKVAMNSVFSHDGKTLYFSLRDKQTRLGDLYSSGLDGKGLKQITKDVYHASAPRLSPDGKWLAFNGTVTADSADHFAQIYVVKTDGTGLKQLTNDPKISFYNPEWSPDGKWLTYYVERGDNKDQIWSMKADGTEQKLLSANIAHNFYPSWSPDGKRIIFTSTRDGKQALYTMRPDGSDVKPFGIESLSVRYSPDGKKIVYGGGQPPNVGIFVANADGSNPVKLLPEK